MGKYDSHRSLVIDRFSVENLARCMSGIYGAGIHPNPPFGNARSPVRRAKAKSVRVERRRYYNPETLAHRGISRSS